MGIPRAGVVMLVCLGCGGGGSTGDPDAPRPDAGPPPAGTGISADYPGDVGIGGDPRVVFFDDFESYANADALWDRWDNVFQAQYTRIATEGPFVYAGAQSVEFTMPVTSQEISNAVSKDLSPEHDVLYLRYYSKYEGNFAITGSSHNGSEVSAHYFIDGQATPGIPADGTNKYLIAYENWRDDTGTNQPTPGHMNVYIYHPAQRDNYGDHFFPNGEVMPNTSLPGDFGPTFVERPQFVPELDRWYAYEVMLQANTPGQRDGRITCWIDGEVIADFPNLRLRDIDTLTIDHFSVGFHAHANADSTRKWYDNVVAATEYIGPMVPL